MCLGSDVGLPFLRPYVHLLVLDAIGVALHLVVVAVAIVEGVDASIPLPRVLDHLPRIDLVEKSLLPLR